MGALVNADVNGGKIRDAMDGPLVYQLVRVEGDGRLVPATDDEVIEVEHLLENDKNEMSSVDIPCHLEECVSSEVISSKKSDLESSEGVSQSGSDEINSRKFNARLEFIDVMLQKVKQEERLRLSCESQHRPSSYMDVDGISSNHLNNTTICRENLQSEYTCLETSPRPVSSSACLRDQPEGVDACQDGETERLISGLFISELSESIKTKISMLKGQICLDNLTIRELQEVFRATFGRETNVKDKRWLKRRLAMGFCKSSELPVSNIVVQDKMIVKSGSLPTGHDKESRDYLFLGSSANPIEQIKEHMFLSGKGLRKSVVDYDANNENVLAEQFAAKRVRKPTKRYIEELSDVETRESTDTDSGHDQSSPISRIRSSENNISKGTTITRQDSFGGFHVEIPYVYRVRRGRPRKNFTSLMNIVGLENENMLMEAPNTKEQDLKHRKMTAFCEISHENADAGPTLKGVPRRKHHRAWTLAEVTKLVEGVSKYGTGRWSEIKRIAFASHTYRTSVDLKDKWRNLLKASCAQVPTENGVRKHGSMPVPRAILYRVRELAKIHSQAGVEFGPSKCSTSAGRAIQEKVAGYL